MIIPGLYEMGFLVKYKEGDTALYRTPLTYIITSADIFYIISEGDSLLSIAERFYNNSALWYVIADANPNVITDVFDLPFNTTITIPDLDTLSLTYNGFK